MRFPKMIGFFHNKIADVISEAELESGLIVYGQTESDNNEIGNIVRDNGYNAEWRTNEQMWFFPVEEDAEKSRLQNELESEFELAGIISNIEQQ